MKRLVRRLRLSGLFLKCFFGVFFAITIWMVWKGFAPQTLPFYRTPCRPNIGLGLMGIFGLAVISGVRFLFRSQMVKLLQALKHPRTKACHVRVERKWCDTSIRKNQRRTSVLDFAYVIFDDEKEQAYLIEPCSERCLKALEKPLQGTAYLHVASETPAFIDTPCEFLIVKEPYSTSYYKRIETKRKEYETRI